MQYVMNDGSKHMKSLDIPGTRYMTKLNYPKRKPGHLYGYIKAADNRQEVGFEMGIFDISGCANEFLIGECTPCQK